MEPLVLNGKALSKELEAKLKERVAKVVEVLGYAPELATILVGDNPASVTYVNMKGKACARVGLNSRAIVLPESTTTEELLAVIDELNADPKVCGILLQHPVPRNIDEKLCFNRIAKAKDVDGVNSASFGAFTMGEEAYKSATPLGIITILKHYGIEMEGKHAVVVGRSAILGKPVAMLLLNENATVTICHSKTKNLKEILLTADIVVGAVGKPNFIQSDWVKEGVVLVDAGYNAGNVGDIDLEKCAIKSSAYTPVPGGVGPMTICMLMTQTVEAAEKLVGLR